METTNGEGSLACREGSWAENYNKERKKRRAQVTCIARKSCFGRRAEVSWTWSRAPRNYIQRPYLAPRSPNGTTPAPSPSLPRLLANVLKPHADVPHADALNPSVLFTHPWTSARRMGPRSAPHLPRPFDLHPAHAGRVSPRGRQCSSAPRLWPGGPGEPPHPPPTPPAGP